MNEGQGGSMSSADRLLHEATTLEPVTEAGQAKDMLLAPGVGSVAFQGFCELYFRYYSRLTVVGKNHLPASPFIICSNHTSHVDSAVLMTASGRPFSAFALLGASDYFFDSWRRKFLVSRFMNIIPIDRRAQPKSLQRCLAMCEDFLQHGNLILYPEGTRSTDGEIQSFKKGAGMFAVDLGVPIVPALVEGAHRILPKGEVVPRPKPVTVRFGEPIMFGLHPGDPGGARGVRRAAVELLEQRIRGLKPSLSPVHAVETL